MSTHSPVRRAFRGAFVLALLTTAYAVNGCGSNSTTGTGQSTGGAGGFGGHVDGGVSGNPSFGGDSPGGAFESGGTTSDSGSGGTTRDSGLGGAANLDAATDASLGDASPSGTGGAPLDAGGDGHVACIPSTTLYDVSSGTPCSTSKFPLCTNGICVPLDLVPKASLAELGDCNATTKCVPKYFVERLGKFIEPTCTSVNGNEGRCLSTCIPQIAAQASSLPKDICGTGDLCAPCYDPRTGVNTGACTQGCDPGPTEPAKPFTKCCTGQGSCVPASLVPAADVSLLGKDTCTGSGQLCAPDKMSDSTFIPASCKSLSNAEGRCLADCLPSVAAQASRLPQATCDTGELCAPCYDPITGKSTGACTQNGDTPKNPPFTYDACCNNLGHCLPTTLLSASQKSELASDTCTSAATLCAPDVFSVAGDTPAPCRALGSFNDEGRCVPTCVPSIKAQASELDQGTPAVCPANTLCAPCYDPISGADTGACSQNGDAPKEPKETFPTCCGGVGLCVPASDVPAKSVSQLGVDTCKDSGFLCAPKSFLDPTAKPATCTAPGNLEARCLPSCLPPIAAQAANLRQETCATNELCAPCYNPLDGTDTGSCEVNGDKPAKPKVTYAGCCASAGANPTSRGTCVPPELLTTSEQADLPADTCGTGFLCAPNLKVKDQSAKFAACIPGGLFGATAPGACVPDCIITNAAEKALLVIAPGTATCKTGELCAPCTNPLAGNADTGACD